MGTCDEARGDGGVEGAPLPLLHWDAGGHVVQLAATCSKKVSHVMLHSAEGSKDHPVNH